MPVEQAVTLQTLEELDRSIAAADRPGADRAKLISSIMYFPDTSQLQTQDPFSTSYSDEVQRIYQHLWGGRYDVADESNIHKFDLKEPGAYSSRHPHLICSHLGSIVTLIRDIGKAPPARVLDLGFGAGDTSLLLARCGFDVDAIDVNETFVESLGYWAERMHVEHRISIANMGFDALGALDRRYDAIVFFEAFHHSLNHAAVMRTLAAKLKDDGVILFAGEPVYDHFPLPWGLRHQEGLATYCIRKLGWMELGFNTAYFLELLERAGLAATHRAYVDYPVANHYRAQKVRDSLPILDLCIHKPYADGWQPPDPEMRWTKGRAGLPIALLNGARDVRVTLQNCAPHPMKVALAADEAVLARAELASGETRVLHATLPAEATSFWIDAPSWSGISGARVLIPSMVPVRFTPTTRFQFSRSISASRAR